MLVSSDFHLRNQLQFNVYMKPSTKLKNAVYAINKVNIKQLIKH
jgi:hypothetical protein